MNFFSLKLLYLLLGFCTGQLFAPPVTTLLWANFESDVIGAAPARDIPGAPEGDTISYTDFIAPALKVVPAKLEGKQALEFTNIEVAKPGWGGYTLLFGSVAGPVDKAITFLWSGRSVYKYLGSNLHIACGFKAADGTVTPLVGMREANGSLVTYPVKNKAGAVGPEVPVGQFNAGDHSVAVIVDVPKQTFKVTIFTPEKGIVGSVNGKLLYKPDVLTTMQNRAIIYFNYGDPFFSDTRKYLIDGLSINKY